MKKRLLGLGMVPLVFTPIVSVISCGGSGTDAESSNEASVPAKTFEDIKGYFFKVYDSNNNLVLVNPAIWRYANKTIEKLIEYGIFVNGKSAFQDAFLEVTNNYNQSKEKVLNFEDFVSLLGMISYILAIDTSVELGHGVKAKFALQKIVEAINESYKGTFSADVLIRKLVEKLNENSNVISYSTNTPVPVFIGVTESTFEYLKYKIIVP